MKEYTIYWIKEEIARYYYYKSDILFRFLKEYHQDNSRNDLAIQFHFITDSFPSDVVATELESQQNQYVNIRNQDNLIEFGSNFNNIALHIQEKHLKFRCETLQDAETLLFPTLRRFHPYLFIIDNNYDNFGWISPARSSIAFNNEQVLYS